MNRSKSENATRFPASLVSHQVPLTKDTVTGKAKSVFHWLAKFQKRESCHGVVLSIETVEEPQQ